MTRFTPIILSLVLIAGFSIPIAAVAATSSYKPSSVGAALEVTMREDGSARVQGARVREVTDTGFVAETLWGSGKLTWTVKTGETTSITRKSGGRIALTQVTPGDYVSFSGTIQTNMPPFTVDADSVRDWSIGDNYVVHSGTVSAIDRANRTFTLTTGKGGQVRVATTGDTAFAQSGAQSFADLAEGDLVLAHVENGKSFTASKVNITERAIVKTNTPPVIATGLGSWIDGFLPRFFVGRT